MSTTTTASGATTDAPLRAAVVGLDSAFWPAAFVDAIGAHPEFDLVAACGLGLPSDVIRRDFVADPDTWLAERDIVRTGSLDDLLGDATTTPEAVITTMPTRVRTVTGTAVRLATHHGDRPDTADALLTLADGRTATAHIRLTVPATWPLAMHEGEVLGDAGVVRSTSAVDTVQVLDAGGEHAVSIDPATGGLHHEVARFVDAVRGRRRPHIDLEDAVHVAEVCAAWRESARRESAPVEVGSC